VSDGVDDRGFVSLEGGEQRTCRHTREHGSMECEGRRASYLLGDALHDAGAVRVDALALQEGPVVVV